MQYIIGFAALGALMIALAVLSLKFAEVIVDFFDGE